MAGEEFDKYDKILIGAVIAMVIATFIGIAYTSTGDAYMHGVCKAKGGYYIHSGLCLQKDAVIDVTE